MSTIKTLDIHFILLLFCIATSCVSKKDSPIIDDEIVLKIGSFEITRYEYEKNKKKAVESRNMGHEEWIKKYIGDSYFLADAYHRRYDTISSINKKVNYAAVSMLGQYKGYLWNRVEEPKLDFSEAEIKEIYSRQNKLYDIAYFLFPDKTALKAILHYDTIVKNEADFKNLIVKCRTSPVSLQSTQLTYPFQELEPAKDQIYGLKQGGVITVPFKKGQILVARLNKTTEIKQRIFEEEKENIRINLRRIKEKQIVEDKQKLIFSKANMIINNQVADQVLKKIQEDLAPEISKTLFADTLMTYVFNGQPNGLLAADFFDRYYNNPFSYEINDTGALHEALKDFVIEKYLYVEGVNLGITKDNEFLLDKRDFMNRLILATYYQNNFYAIKVSDTELYDYYTTHKRHFSQSKACHASIFIFKDKPSAFFSMSLVRKIAFQKGIQEHSDTSSMMGLISCRQGVFIDTERNEYPEEFATHILTSGINTPVGPLEFDNQTYICVKTQEDGREIQPFEVAKVTIEKQLLAEQREILKNKKLADLMNQYPATINKINTTE